MRRPLASASWIRMLLLSAFVSGGFNANNLYGGETDPPCRLERYIDESSLLAIVEAEDLAALRSVWRRLPFHDLVQRVVYYTRLTRLEPNKANELALLETVPTSPIEFRYFCAINDTKAWDTHPMVPELYHAYFTSIGKFAARHAEYIKRVLVMNRFADGVSKNDTDEATRILKELNPEGYLAALKELDPETRGYVCGDCPELQAVSSERNP